MSTHNIYFCQEIRKIICAYPLLSVAMLMCTSYTSWLWAMTICMPSTSALTSAQETRIPAQTHKLIMGNYKIGFTMIGSCLLPVFCVAILLIRVIKLVKHCSFISKHCFCFP